MKLDPRIIEGKKPFDCVDAESETVKSFIGKKGYFANHISEFIDISDLKEDVLTGINPHDPDCEVYKATCTTWEVYKATCTTWEYFLPKEWVKEPEKKYRPFSIEDWKFKHSIGETILYRYRGTYCCDHSEAELAYLGFIKPLDGITDEAGKGQIVLGNNAHGLQNLFDDYEMWVDGNWEPFGVLDEGDE